jgi:hypothetical protein
MIEQSATCWASKTRACTCNNSLNLSNAFAMPCCCSQLLPSCLYTWALVLTPSPVLVDAKSRIKKDECTTFFFIANVHTDWPALLFFSSISATNGWWFVKCSCRFTISTACQRYLMGKLIDHQKVGFVLQSSVVLYKCRTIPKSFTITRTSYRTPNINVISTVPATPN